MKYVFPHLPEAFKKTTICLFLLAGLFTLDIQAQTLPGAGSAQQDPSMRSDWIVRINVNFPSLPFTCAPEPYFIIGYKGTALGNYVPTASTSPPTSPGYPAYAITGMFSYSNLGSPPTGISVNLPPGLQRKNFVLFGVCAGASPIAIDTINLQTDPIYAPINLTASVDDASGSTLSSILLSWGKGTDLPVEKVGYKIYRDGILIHTQSPGDDSYEYRDISLVSDTSYTYAVTTYTDNPGGWLDGYVTSTLMPPFTGPFNTNVGIHESVMSTPAIGSTSSLGFTATEGDFIDRVKLKWKSAPSAWPAVDNIRISRSVPVPLQTSQTGTVEELAILNKNATAYTDTDAIPGYRYTYYLFPLASDGSVIRKLDFEGWMKPNGTIKGRVISRAGSGVQNVTITVDYSSSLPGDKAAAISSYNAPFTATTDVDGYYEVQNIYYFDDADFVITPSYSSHGFTPSSSSRNLNLLSRTQAGVNFTDTTAITVGGNVAFQSPSDFGATGTGFGVENATIFINGADYGIRTNTDGNWSFALTNPGSYDFRVSFKHHTFAEDSFTHNITIDKTDINFLNTQEDTIQIKVQDGCQNPLATFGGGINYPKVRIVHARGASYFDGLFPVNGSGYDSIILPASKFSLKVDNTAGQLHEISNPVQRAQLDTISFTVDMTARDSMRFYFPDTTSRTYIPAINTGTTDSLGNPIIIPADTTYEISEDSAMRALDWQADFVYFGPFDVNILWEEGGATIYQDCNTNGSSAGDSIIVLESRMSYLLNIQVVDIEGGCQVDTGSIKIWDYIGDKEQSPVTIPIQNGNAFYEMQAGIPNIASGGANPFQKLFFTHTTAGARIDQPNVSWALVTGAKQLTPTFVSRSPEIPSLVLHDPPGDQSYAWVEKGTSYRTFENTSYEAAGSVGLFIDMTIGTSIKSPFSEANLGIQVEVEQNFGGGYFENEYYESTITFTERFSTSNDPLFTGHDGDVYIGKATNQQFAIAKVLTYNDTATCEANVSDEPAIYPIGIATNFIYSEKHIKNVLIPQIEYLESSLRIQGESASGSEKSDLIAQADLLGIDASNWKGILNTANDARTTDAVFLDNISFSAGASYEETISTDTTVGGSFELTEFWDLATNLTAKAEVKAGVWSDNTVGVAASMRQEWTQASGEDTNNTFEVGYHLEDKDIGDFFSVNVSLDTDFNTPAFSLVAGTSSCPQEAGTQARDRANLNIFPPQIDNVPKGGSAVFTAQMINESESQETREYQVRVIPQSNPGGAVVTMGGTTISNGTVSYVLDAFEASEVDLKVTAGPRAANYDSIAVMMFPPCEYALWEDNGNLVNGDTFYITVNFESECSNVAITNPANNWLVNANNSNLLPIDFAGYDLNNPFLESVTLEYELQNGGWVDGPTIYRSKDKSTYHPADSLEELSYRLFWDVSGLVDGAYKIRARANCTSGKGYTLSSAFSGLIDRNSVAPFGIPSPSDGFLRLGQLISVSFDKDIDCGFTDIAPTYSPLITLMRSDDSTFIPLNVQCSENDNQINLLPTINLFNMPDLEGVDLIARVQGIKDLQGNTQDYPISWNFVVNASPVYWDPDSLNLALATGQLQTFSSTLKNTAGLSKAFTISDYPQWLTPSVLSGSILSNGEYEIHFTVESDLLPGIYQDTVIAMVDGWPEILEVNYESLAIPPNWVVNPNKYDYSMNMILAFSLDQTNTNLSRDDRDMVAAIFNGEVRGVAQLEYVSQFNKYLAFLTVYSNIPANEEISFSMWRAATGVEYIAAETYFFASEQVYGRINNPEILHTDGVFQVIPLKQGWNWVSLNVENTDMTIHNLLSSLGSSEVGNNVTVKRKDGNTATYTQIVTQFIYSNQWSGPLVQLDNEQAYLINLSNAPDTLRVPGEPITTFSNIDVFSGWNWIGFQPQSAQPLQQALNSLNLRNLDLLKGQEAFSQYHRGTSTWFGPLKFMEPGKGYKLKLKNGVTYNDLVYSRLGLKDFSVDHTRYESSMTLIGSMGLEESGENMEERLLVGAFIDDTCRGYGFLEYVEFLKEYRVIFSMHGNSSDIGRPVTFKVYDTRSGQEFIPDNEPEVYISDRILGEMMDPYVLFENLALPEASYFLEQNYPNPYDSKTHIRFILPQQEQVKLTVFDQFGKEVQVLINGELTPGEHTFVFDGSKLPSGIYYYSLKAGEYRVSRKMVKF